MALWWILAGLFVGGVYAANHFIKPKKTAHAGATFAQKHTLLILLLAVLVPIVVGLVLANTTFSQRSVVKKTKVNGTPGVSVAATRALATPPEPVLKMIISDGSLEVDIAALNRCDSDEVTVIENQVVVCKGAESPQVKTWLQDARRQEAALLKKYLASQQPPRKQTKVPPQKVPPPMMQGFNWFAPVPEKAVVGKKTVQEKKPFRDRHAEVFFFLALVAGVMSKYFWDFYEERSQGKKGTFEPHVIVMSFIISALIYYSIQQGLEKEAGKLTTRGILFAFNNGFMWQTILKSTRLSNGSKATATTDKQPS